MIVTCKQALMFSFQFFSNLLLVDYSFRVSCVRIYYTPVFTMWISLTMKTVYLGSVTGFSVRGRGFLRVYSCDRKKIKHSYFFSVIIYSHLQ